MSLAASAAGNAVVAWKHRDGNTYTVWTSHLAGGRWGPPEPIRTRGSELSTPEVAMDDAGNAVVAWIETEGIRANIVAARVEVARTRGGDAAP